MKMKSLFAAVAVATMAVVPAVANAGTSAASSLHGVKPVLSSTGSEYRAARSVKKEQGLSAATGLIGLFATSLVVFTVVKVADGTSASNG